MHKDKYYDELVEVTMPRKLAIKLKHILSQNPDADVVDLAKVKEIIMQYIAEQTVSKYPTAELCKCAKMSAEGVIYALEYAFE